MTALGETLLCPTNHSFFRMGGGDLGNLWIRIPINYYAPRAEIGMPTGGPAPVEGTVFDFTNWKRLHDGLASHPEYWHGERPGYDDFYARENPTFGLMGQAYDERAGYLLSLYSDMQSLVFCTPAPRAAGDTEYSCFCMEPQFVPNAVNCNGIYRSPLFPAGSTLETTTVYKFSIERPFLK